MLRLLLASWGLLGIFFLVGRALWRLSVIALDGILNYPLPGWQWAVLIAWIVINAYSEGYKGFQKKFSPRTVARAWYLADNPTVLRVILGPFFTMGFFDANRKTKITAYIVVILVTLLVMFVSGLSQPWRGIIDAGVVAGLGWGLISILVIFAKTCLSGYEDLDPCMPEAMGTPNQNDDDLTSASKR
jgi:hypothetical protein